MIIKHPENPKGVLFSSCPEFIIWLFLYNTSTPFNNFPLLENGTRLKLTDTCDRQEKGKRANSIPYRRLYPQPGKGFAIQNCIKRKRFMYVDIHILL